MKFSIFRYEMLHFHIYTHTKGSFNAINQKIFLKKVMINIYILNYLNELLRCISNRTKKNTPAIMLRKIIHFRNIYNEFAFLIFPNDNNPGIIIYLITIFHNNITNIIFEFKTSFFTLFVLYTFLLLYHIHIQVFLKLFVCHD